MNVTRRVLATVLVLAALAVPFAHATDPTIWTCRSISLPMPNRYWYDSAHVISRETLPAVDFDPGTVASVIHAGDEVLWTVMAVNFPSGTITMWVRESPPAAVAVLDADAYSAGDIAAVYAP